MTYKNANEVLPCELVKEIQKYVNGCLLYIPISSETKLGWGEQNGTKQKYIERNSEICMLYENNVPISVICSMFFLSEDSVRKVIRQNKKNKEKA